MSSPDVTKPAVTPKGSTEQIPGLETQLASVREAFQSALAEAVGSEDRSGLMRVKSQFFGPKGEITSLLGGLGRLPADVRPVAGKLVNLLKRDLEGKLLFEIEREASRERDRELRRSRLDLTLPGRAIVGRGALHPVSRVIYEITDLFLRMGFEIATGPEVELDFYNFEALNFPKEHPARDMQDTFFVHPPDARGMQSILLRTHTSPVQIRSMEKRGAPIRIISPGRVYRCDQDATHSPMFHQVEGLWIDEGVSFAHLKGVLTSFLNAFFGHRPVRFRPSYFPFVEPGAEIDIQCVLCDGKGCRVCKSTGWMEILGAGMVHPKVLDACKVDSERYTGFAFGLGVDRIAMLRWHIDDLAHLFRSDLRFLTQI